MGLTYNIYLNGGRIYGCRTCKTHLSNHDDILSRVCARGAQGTLHLS
jgi:hypothetical protein